MVDPWLGLVLGGALGNLADRVFRHRALHGHVVDFIAIGWWRCSTSPIRRSCGSRPVGDPHHPRFDYDGGRSGWAARRFPADDSTPSDDSAQADDSAAADAETGDARA